VFAFSFLAGPAIVPQAWFAARQLQLRVQRFPLSS